jgi:IS5 family transposase
MYGRYAHARQYKQARKQLRKVKTYLGTIRRDIERKLQPEFTTLAKTPLIS